MNKLIKVAIIGGIGSGKSEVVKILRSKGAKVLVADEINNELFDIEDYNGMLREYFPELPRENKISKKDLSRLIFSDESKRMLLMSIAHPRIERIMNERAIEGIVFFEIPLINECKMQFDYYWFVYSDEAKRVERIRKRTDISYDIIKQIMQVQGQMVVPISAKVIDNNYGTVELADKVEELYCELQKSLYC